jgi:hypothetical protein
MACILFLKYIQSQLVALQLDDIANRWLNKNNYPGIGKAANNGV